MTFAFSAVFAFVPARCMSLHMSDSSAWFPHPSASPMHRMFMPTGEFGGFGLFEVLLTVLCVFAVVLAPF